VGKTVNAKQRRLPLTKDLQGRTCRISRSGYGAVNTHGGMDATRRVLTRARQPLVKHSSASKPNRQPLFRRFGAVHTGRRRFTAQQLLDRSRPRFTARSGRSVARD
jgi:hypothetical protein